MVKNKAWTWRYLRQVRSWLPCSCKAKRKIIGEIKSNIDDFMTNNPDAQYTNLVARFGTPQEIAASYVNEMDMGELLNSLRIRKKIVRTIAAMAAMIVMLWLGQLTLVHLHYLNQADGYMVDTIEVIEREIYDETGECEK